MKQGVELKPKNKEGLNTKERETLASFKMILQPWPWGNQHDKIDLLLVWRDFKSATQLSLDPEISDSDLKKTEDVLRNAGLFFKDTGIIQDPRQYGSRAGRIFFVANNLKDLELISQIRTLGTPEAYSEMGRMSGYPKSAVENFVQFHKLHNSDLSDQSKFYLTDDEMEHKIPKELRKFVQFKLSRNNWQNELETIRRWADEIKMIDPELYNNLY